MKKKPDELTVIKEAMFAALDEHGDTLAGTALLGLENLSRTHEAFEREEITTKAVEIAADESAYMESRLTALRLAAGLTTQPSPKATADKPEYSENTDSTNAGLATTITKNNKKSLSEDSVSSSLSRRSLSEADEAGGEVNSGVAEAARVLAQTGETVLMRSAAIVTLGEVGGASDRELLEPYLQADNRQIAAAAKMALVKMDKRN